METKVITDKQDLTYLEWSHIRSSSGTAGTFLKSQSTLGNSKIYYKLSNFEEGVGIIGHESVNEIIVDRLLTLLGVEHLHYQLIHADIEVDGKIYTTYVCASEDFKKRGESKAALDAMYKVNKEDGESAYDYCKRMGFEKYIDTMIAIDFIILNRDRHGANLEMLRDTRNHTLRIAPYFDHGLSLLFSCHTDEEIQKFDVMGDIKCNNFIGTKSNAENLKLIGNKKVFEKKLKYEDKDFVFKDLDNVLSNIHRDKIWEMIMERWNTYENL